MKVALIVECARDGLEDSVCPKILQLLAVECKVEIKYAIRTMSGKGSLVQDCAATAGALLSKGYDRVVVVWDENPPWTEEKAHAEDRCWHFERDGIRARLEAAEIPLDRVGLVCVEHEFETILMHDTRLLRAVISPGEEHPAKIKKVNRPLSIDNPTDWLERQFRKNKSSYNKAVVAKKFAKHLTDLRELKRCDIFRRLAEKILGQMPQGWEPYDYEPRGPKR